MHNKAEMGINALIIFIALLLVAGIVAVVLMQTSSSLQGETMLSAEDSKSHMSTALRFVDVTLHKDSNGEYKNLEAVVKLLEGSQTIIVQDMMIFLKLQDTTAPLLYRGIGSTFDNSATGFRTLLTQEIGEAGVFFSRPTSNIAMTWSAIPSVDYDLDGIPDTNKICCSGPNACPDSSKNANQGWMAINVSSYGITYIQITTSTGTPIALCSATGTADNDRTPVEDFGYISVLGLVGGGSINMARVSYYLKEMFLTQDLDNDDDYEDYLAVNATHAIFSWTNGDTDIIPLGVDLSLGPASISLDKVEIGNPAKGYLTISGSTSRANYIDESVIFQVEPLQVGGGFFSVTSLQQSGSYREGYIQYGDVTRIGMQLPRSLSDSETLIIQVIPNEGMPIDLKILTPQVLSGSKMRLFP